MAFVFSLFPKFLSHLDPEALAETVQSCGLDTVNLVVRQGFPVTPGNLMTAGPCFLKAMDAAGLQVRFATAAYSPEELLANADPLHQLADLGIELVRIGYLPLPERIDLDAYRLAGQKLGRLSHRARQAGIKIIYQVHHQTLLPSTTAVLLAQSLSDQPIDTASLGYMIDPGNQFHEGRENPRVMIEQLGSQLLAIGVKDVEPKRSSEGLWRFPWVSLPDGCLEWPPIVRLLPKTSEIWVVLMPFYHQNDPGALIRSLQREVRYFRELLND